MNLNRPGPHRKDVDRFIREIEKYRTRLNTLSTDDRWAEIDCEEHVASTGSIYVTVLFQGFEYGDSAKRKYRFASHDICYDADYSIASGSTIKKDQDGKLPLGFDGTITDAIADLDRWMAENIKSLEGKII